MACRRCGTRAINEATAPWEASEVNAMSIAMGALGWRAGQDPTNERNLATSVLRVLPSVATNETFSRPFPPFSMIDWQCRPAWLQAYLI